MIIINELLSTTYTSSGVCIFTTQGTDKKSLIKNGKVAIINKSTAEKEQTMGLEEVPLGMFNECIYLIEESMDPGELL